jgi:acetyl-CoA synthase
VAQRDHCWLRISKEAAKNGLKFKHYGDLLIAKYKSEFPAIVDRCRYTIYTDPEKVSEWHKVAKETYARRDDRIAGFDGRLHRYFLSCLLSQSFAPNQLFAC